MNGHGQEPPLAQDVDLDGFLLPALAYVESAKVIVMPSRREALDLAFKRFSATRSSGGDEAFETHLAFIDLVGESMTLVELVGTWADALLNGYPGTSLVARATHYRPFHVNNFFNSAKKLTAPEVLTVAGLAMNGTPICDVIPINPPMTERDREAFLDAANLTAAMLKREFVDLAEAWEISRRLFHAAKHAGVVVPPNATFRDDSVPLNSVMVWYRKSFEKPRIEFVAPPFDQAAKAVKQAGERAAQVLEHIVLVRDAVSDQIVLGADKIAKAKEWIEPNWGFWLDPRDLRDGNEQILKDRFKASFR